MSPKRPLALGFCSLILLGACTHVPELEKLHTDLPQTWPADPALLNAQPGAAHWWQAWNDAPLNALINAALQHNRDRNAAMLRIDEARALVADVSGLAGPTVSAGVSSERSRNINTVPKTQNTHRLGVTAAFEIDLWGRYRHALAGAKAQLLASEYARDVVQRTLIDQVIQTELALRATRAEHALLQEQAALLDAQMRLQRLRLDSGLDDATALHSSELARAALSGQSATLTAQARLYQQALAQLIGATPRAMAESFDSPGQKSVALPSPATIPAGLPSTLLERRPDLRLAAAQLEVNDAKLREIRAALLPSLALTANLGSESHALGDLFTAGSNVWGLGIAAAQSLYTAGRSQAVVDAAVSRRQQQLNAYAAQIETAFREVYDALIVHRQRREQAAAIAQQQTAAHALLKIATAQEAAGVISALQKLTVELKAKDADILVLRNQHEQLAAYSTLQKVLGN